MFYQVPNYRDWDSTLLVTGSFTLFFPMVVADAGYGVIVALIVTALWLAQETAIGTLSILALIGGLACHHLQRSRRPGARGHPRPWPPPRASHLSHRPQAQFRPRHDERRRPRAPAKLNRIFQMGLSEEGTAFRSFTQKEVQE